MSAISVPDVLKELSTTALSLGTTHPRRLERWWKALVGAPDVIYLQLSCEEILEHIRLAKSAIELMTHLLGTEHLPVAPQESAQRYIESFTWHVTGATDSGTYAFEANWDRGSKKWAVTCRSIKNVTKLVSSLEEAVGKGAEWATELDAQVPKNPEDLKG